MIRIISFEHVDPKRENCWSCEEFKNALIPKATINSEAAPIHIIKRTVRNLADAVSQADQEGVEDLLDDARMDIQELLDPTIGKLELRDYGYTAEDMVPLRKEAALDYHRMGSKIYCLGSDGSKGEYAS